MFEFSPLYRFADWPNPTVPEFAAGVYAIWNKSLLIYCGMSGRTIERTANDRRKRYGLYTRLASHANGRLSGDQFCVYVANRLVIPTLSMELLPKFASGELNLDKLTKSFIREHLEYQFAVVATSKEAFDLELQCCCGIQFGKSPLLNPRLIRQ